MKQNYLDDAYLSSFCFELSLLVRAGVPFADGFLMMHDDDNDAASAGLMLRLSALSEAGVSLSAALNEEGSFPDHLLSVLRVAEKTGRLETALTALSDHYDKQAALKKSLSNAVAYPAMLVVIMLAVILTLIWGVLPVFDGVFAQLGLSMPPFALFLMRLSRSVSTFVLILALIGALLALFYVLMRFSSTFRAACKKTANAWFIKTNTGRTVSRSRFTSAMAMALASGLDTDEALALIKTMFISDKDAVKRIDDCTEYVREGKPFEEALYLSGLLGARDSRMAALGVKTGTIEAAMTDIAKRSDSAAQERIDAIIARIEPALVTFTSVIIGGILLVVMLPLASIMSSIG